MKAKGKVGRPRAPVERMPLSLRVTPEVRNRLERAIKGNGRSISQEAELRLEMSFRNEKLLPQILSLAYGPRQAGLILLVAEVLHRAGSWSALPDPSDLAGNWPDSSYALNQATDAVGYMLAMSAPIKPPEDIPDDQRRVDAGWATLLVDTLARAVAGEQSAGPELLQIAVQVRDLFPDLADRFAARLSGKPKEDYAR